MKVGIIGSGQVGKALAQGFLARGDQVWIGSRRPDEVDRWAAQEGLSLSGALPEEAAARGELLVLATAWAGVAESCDRVASQTAGKILIDVTNPLRFDTAGEPPVLDIVCPDSAGATVQRLLPESKVVKCFNIVNCRLMVRPQLPGGPPDMFACGDDDEAKAWVLRLCEEWGWHAHDAGGIRESYLLESLALIWIRYGFANNQWEHAFALLNR